MTVGPTESTDELTPVIQRKIRLLWGQEIFRIHHLAGDMKQEVSAMPRGCVYIFPWQAGSMAATGLGITQHL